MCVICKNKKTNKTHTLVKHYLMTLTSKKYSLGTVDAYNNVCCSFAENMYDTKEEAQKEAQMYQDNPGQILADFF
jgi:hypothetical protein